MDGKPVNKFLKFSPTAFYWFHFHHLFSLLCPLIWCVNSVIRVYVLWVLRFFRHLGCPVYKTTKQDHQVCGFVSVQHGYFGEISPMKIYSIIISNNKRVSCNNNYYTTRWMRYQRYTFMKHSLLLKVIAYNFQWVIQIIIC